MIRGRVLAADNSVPIRRAIVSLASAAPPQIPRQIYTDANGRYEFRGLAAGEYIVRAAPSQFQGQFLAPASPIGGPPRITVSDGQVVDGHDLMLTRGGAIVGRLVDADGDPVSGVHVSAQRVGRSSTYYQATPSDEHGRYRIYRLAPGYYTILAKPYGSDYLGDGPASIGYVNTYHPSAYARAEAATVRVRAGEETAAGDLTMIRARMLRVTGTVLDSRGSPPSSTRTIVSLDGDDVSYGGGVSPSGRFVFSAQPPATYRLTARLRTREGVGDPDVEYADMTVTLLDSDAEDLVLTMKPTVTVRGRVIFEGTAPPRSPDSMHISVRERSIRRPSDEQNALAYVGADLSFTLRGLAGERVLRPEGLPPGWTLKSVLLGDTDITDVPTEFKDSDTGLLRIVLTARSSEIAGKVTDDTGQPVEAAQVLLFPEDKAFWFATPTRIRVGESRATGGFSFAGVPGGRYHLIALPRERAIDERAVDPLTLEALVQDASSVFIGDDERRQVDLKLSTLNKR